MIRNAVLATIVLALGTTLAPAQSDNWGNKLFGGATSHDFGSVPRGALLYHRFQITNIYAVRLEIMNVRVSCGCVTATPSTQVLEPGQAATLDITMDAHRFTGPKNVSVYVTVGPQYISTATLQVSAQSRADIVFNPGQVSFGVVPRGQTPTEVIDVEYAGGQDWRVSEVIKNTAPVNGSLEQLYRRPGQVGYRISVTLKPDAPPGPFREELLLKTNDPATPLVPVLVEGTIQAPLTVIPSTLSLGSPKAGELVTRKVVVRGSRPFKILAIDGLGDGISAALPSTAATVQILTLKCQVAQPGDLHRQLQIRTDLGQEEPTTVTVEGTVLP